MSIIAAASSIAIGSLLTATPARLLLLAQISINNLELKSFRFRGGESSVANQYIVFAVFGVFLCILIFALALYMRHRAKQRIAYLNRQEARLRLMLSELNLSVSDRQLLTGMLESDNPNEILPLLEYRALFEKTAKGFREANKKHPALSRIPQLRQKLNYGFNNPRNPVVDTRMLPPGLKIRCKIKLASREMKFVSTILAVTETHLLIRPPTSNKQPVSLGKVKSLTCVVARENDAEYEFDAAVQGQTPDKMRAVIMAHSTDISRLLFRHAPRIPVNIETRFYVIRQEFMGDRSATAFKAKDSQYVFPGLLKDLSIGGALVTAARPERKPEEGDMIVFRLQSAQIQEDLLTQVVGVVDQDDGQMRIHLQYISLKELNRLKLNKFLADLDTGDAAPPPDVQEQAAPAPL